jgi:hypothetical protein
MKRIPPEAPSAPPPRGRRQQPGRAGSAAAAWLCISMLWFCAACSPIEPWVKPYERERLADPIMQVSPHQSLAAKHSEHVREVREGGRGANGVQGGGCGCN